MIYRDELRMAIEAARSFIDRAEYLLEQSHEDSNFCDSGAHAATVKRKSMDLTRLLAAIRK